MTVLYKNTINVETGHNFKFSRNALKTSGFSLKDGLECFNTSSNINVHSVSVIYILVIFKCKIDFTSELDNNMNRQASFLLKYMSLFMLILSRKFETIFTSHIP